MAAGSTPLLSDLNSAESKHTPLLPSLDDKIELCLENFSWAQFLQATILSLAWMFDAQQTFISVFTDAEPKWHCTSRGDSVCNSVSICDLPKAAWAWDFPSSVSVISDWNLECASAFVKGLPASSFFTGCLIGGLALSALADSSLGRKKTLLLSCSIMALSSILTIFSTNIWIYSVLRFMNGFGRATVGTCSLVLATELVGKRWRAQVGAIGFFCFTLGFLSLPFIAYMNKYSSWKVIYLWTSIPTIVYCVLVHLFVQESPRWLFVIGRKEEAVSILKSIMSPASNLISMSFSDLRVGQETKIVDLYSAFKILLEKSWARWRLSRVMVVGFGIGLVYYGMPLGLTNLSFNLYLSVTLNALSELPASMIVFFLIGKLNRKISLLAFTMLSGVFSILTIVLGNSNGFFQIGLESVSFFLACSAFNVILLYTVELFPTCVRNLAMSLVRQAVVFGGVFSPMLVAAGGKNGFLTYGVFGSVIGLCGLFVIGLPETRGSRLCDTMDEEEHKQNAVLCDYVSA